MSRYFIRYSTKNSIGRVCRTEFDSDRDIEDLLPECLPVSSPDDAPIELLSVTIDGERIPKDYIAELNDMFFSTIDECDGAGAATAPATGDGGAAAGGSSSAGDAGDICGEMPGTSIADVLGTNVPGEGYFGKDNFYMPSRVPFPLHRWSREIYGGGGTSRKGKKKKKNLYTSGMKTIVNMFEDEHGAPKVCKYTREQLIRAINYWTEVLRRMD